jgi:hypothetical protein
MDKVKRFFIVLTEEKCSIIAKNAASSAIRLLSRGWTVGLLVITFIVSGSGDSH